jgi:hypothetical protein
MKRYLLSLAISMNIDESDTRMEKMDIRRKQYINGIRALLKYKDILNSNSVDIHISDNTTDTLDEDIRKELPPQTIIRCFINNRFGKINKGAGLLEKWNYNRQLFSQYEYIIHFEPRPLLENPAFFLSFFKNPRNLFTKGVKDDPTSYNLYTGCFALKTELLFEFLNIVSPELLCEHMLSIEDVMGKLLWNIVDFIDIIGHRYISATDKSVSIF